MKIFEQVSYDPQADACYIQISKESVFDTEIKENGIIVDKDAHGNTIWIEIIGIKQHRTLIDRLLFSQESIEQCVSH